MGRSERFAIVGAGIGGLTLAIALQRKGFNVSVFENAPSLKPLGAGLALAANAVNAFSEIGIADAVLNAGSILRKLMIKDDSGRILAETDSEKVSKKYNTVNNFTIHRADLHEVLLAQLSTNVHLRKGCIDFIRTPNGVKLIFQDGTNHDTDYVIACDGVHSIFRKKLLPESQPRYAGYTCWRAVIDTVPSSVDMQVTSETWGRGSRFGIAPLNNGRLYWFACINAKENDPTMRSYRVKDLLNHFRTFHSPVPEILQHTRDEQLIWNDIIDIKPITKFAFGRIVLMGDAAHATTPNMGQGACLAIEDAVILANTIANTHSVELAFIAFEQKRIQRTTTVVNDSWKLGRIAQWESPLLIKMRNMLLRMTPQSVAEKQIKFIIDVKFQ
jgi:2-polyprenyl-6-methoxyphenol hydroxylase-like FAD-dependent oxidoreductase